MEKLGGWILSLFLLALVGCLIFLLQMKNEEIKILKSKLPREKQSIEESFLKEKKIDKINWIRAVIGVLVLVGLYGIWK